MLIDIQGNGSLLNDDTGFREKCELTDSDFGSIEVVGCASEAYYSALYAGAVISEYGKRNLNVASNLAKLLSILEEKDEVDVKTALERWKLYQPLFTQQLEEELTKYMALM